MPAKSRNAVLNPRRVALDMLQLAVRGTVAALLIAGLAMGVVAFAAS